MKEIIKWLREKELQASDLYQQAALIYEDDPTFKEFLVRSAEDEASHYHVMGSAAEYLASEPDFIPAISVDTATNNKINKKISSIKEGLSRKSLSKSELIEKIVELELTEWNDIFLYAVNFLKKRSSIFKYTAPQIQRHINEIEYFLEKTENHPEILRKIKELPPVWVENILIVDDEKMITELIKSLLNRSGNIDVAHNGQDALKLMKGKFYKLIISDINMPLMDGLTFYKEAVKKYHATNNRFLFMTGDLSPEKQIFFNENQVKYLTKPMDISVLREEASKIIISK